MTMPPEPSTCDEPVATDPLRQLRHELRTPLNHLLGYAELLIEDMADLGEPWDSHLRRIHEVGQELLIPVAALVEALRDGADPAEALASIRTLSASIDDACDVLATESERIGAADATADLGVIRRAARQLAEFDGTRISVLPVDTGDSVASIHATESAGAVDDPGVILVVDDDQHNRDMLSRRLQRLGHTVETVPGGREALASLTKRQYDVLLLDVMMPDIDGFEVLARLKSDAALRELPVIMLSALDEVDAAVRCIEMGADDYLAKPINAVLLRARIGACMERKRLRDTELAYLQQAAQVTGPAILAQAIVETDQVDTMASLRTDIVAEATWIDVPKGMTLFKPGDPGDRMYVVVSGRLRVDEIEESGQRRQRGEVRRGGTIGELDMLTGRVRDTTVTAVRDARLARISRVAFERLASAYPRELTRTNRDVVDRLREAFQPRPVPESVTTFALLPVGRDVPIAEIARDLTATFESLGSTLLLDRDHLPALFGHAVDSMLEHHDGSERLAAALNETELRHRYVFYQADPEPSNWTRRCLRQADQVLLVGQGAPPTHGARLMDEVERLAERAPVDLIVLHPSGTTRPRGTGAWLDAWGVRLHHHLRQDDASSMARLVRRLSGTSVDLVLGGGGARGWAHVGAIRALEEAGIPIDAVGGTSMGALIGGASIAGLDWREIQEQARVWSSPRRLFDYTLPIVSIVAGNKITSMLQTVFGDVCIEDLWRGFFCVSGSLSHARPVVHRRGAAWKGVRASISLPGFLPPVSDGDQLLIDGSYLNNIPTDLMRSIHGSGAIVAVSVSQDGELDGDVGTGPVVSGWDMLRRRVAPWESGSTPPSFAATILRASSLSGAYHLDASMALADLAVYPPVGQFGTLDFAAYQQIIDAGYEATCRQLDQWPLAPALAASPATVAR